MLFVWHHAVFHLTDSSSMFTFTFRDLMLISFLQTRRSVLHVAPDLFSPHCSQMNGAKSCCWRGNTLYRWYKHQKGGFSSQTIPKMQLIPWHRYLKWRKCHITAAGFPVWSLCLSLTFDQQGTASWTGSDQNSLSLGASEQASLWFHQFGMEPL